MAKKITSVQLFEPPDIIIDFDGSRLGISCKKLYSEKNVEKVLSGAVEQIEDQFDFGIVAINLDDLIPADQVLRVAAEGHMRQLLIGLNDEFLRRHERHFKKYLASGRLASALVSTTVIAEVLKWRVPFNNARQWTGWTIPGLALLKNQVLNRFYNSVIG
ncbi:MAG: hypothetical protein ACREBC_17495 [Pyrinomonadaceae bacterium]